MPKAKFENIYQDLKQKIESQEYPYQELLPSENTMVDIYGCSRNTIRRAVAELAEDGYVQSLHGKGVRVIYQPVDQASFTIGGIESFSMLPGTIKRPIPMWCSLQKSLQMNGFLQRPDSRQEVSFTISNVSVTLRIRHSFWT